MPGKQELPRTLERSDAKAQRTWIKVHDAAVSQYGEGERAHRTAFDALKHSYEKVGDHWERKAKKGPSDAQAARSGPTARRGGKTAEGVDANATRKHLYELAQRAGIEGRSTMTKDQLVTALQTSNRRATDASRRRDERD